MRIDLPYGANTVISALEADGYEAYAVGGCVRDSLLGLTPHDWDITTNATPEEVLRCFDGYRVIETGLQHGTVTVLIDGDPYEVTTYRVDGEYADNRHPSSVSYVKDIRQDLARRDFTINAMAFNPGFGVIDVFGGRHDIAAGVIRCVGNSHDRFQEDGLRILRALRFASTYGFSIDPETSGSIHELKHLLNNIASERISSELNRTLLGTGVAHILREYVDVLCVFIPEIQPMIGFQQNNPHHYLDVWEHTIKAVQSARQDVIIRLTMLFHDIGKPLCYSEDEAGVGHFYGHPANSAKIAAEVLKRLRYDNHTLMRVRDLIDYHDIDMTPNSKTVRRRLNKFGEEALRQLIQVKVSDVSAQSLEFQADRLKALSRAEQMIDEVIAQRQCFSLKDLAVNGRDIIGAGVPEGVQIGETLNWLLGLVVDGDIDNDCDKLLELAKNK